MMTVLEKTIDGQGRYREILGCLLVSILAAVLNMLPISLGWGLDIILGPFVIMACVRVMRPSLLVLAAACSGAVSAMIWHHPWAALILTCEAAIIVGLRARILPIIADLAFWVVLGMPLVLLTYSGIMDMAPHTALLVAQKQAINGLLAVSCGELAYCLYWIVYKPCQSAFPRIPMEGVIMASLIVTCALPVLFFTRVVSLQDQTAIIDRAGIRANAGLMIANLKIAARLPHCQKGHNSGPSQLTQDLTQCLQNVKGAGGNLGRVYARPAGSTTFLPVGAPIEPGDSELVTRAARTKGGGLVVAQAFGTPLMTSLAQAAVGKSGPGPGKIANLIILVPVASQVMLAQNLQSRSISLLLFLIAALILIVSVFAVELKVAMQRVVDKAMGLSRAANENEMVPFEISEREVFSEIEYFSRQISDASLRVADQQLALRSSQRQLENIATKAPVIIYAFRYGSGNEPAPLLLSNKLWEVLGYPPTTFKGLGWWRELLHPDDHAAVMREKLAPSVGQLKAKEYRLRRSDGQFVWFLDSVFAEQSEVGALETVGVMIDVSEFKIVEQQLLHADKMASLGRMAVGIAHEINQPLQIISLLALNVQKGIELDRYSPDNVLAKIESMQLQVQRARKIIDQMKMYGGNYGAGPERVNIAQVVQSVMAMVAPQFQASAISLHGERLSNSAEIIANRVAVEQILLNLILNAHDAVLSTLQHSRQHGVVTVACRREGNSAIVTVSDNGGGVPCTIRDRIFEPFFTTKPATEGTGLGLGIAHGLARNIGGDIHFENVADGAVFTVSLPIAT